MGEDEALVVLRKVADALTVQPSWRLKLRWVGPVHAYRAQVRQRGKMISEAFSESLATAIARAFEQAAAAQ